MKFTLNWLKEYLETDASLEQISETLTAIGLEVEEIIDPAAELSAFTVAKVEAAKPHPDADRLQVCEVNTGSKTLQIVCGAPNARAGIKVALAQEGVIIPNGEFKIKKSKIRGVESNGMLCSAKELNLGEDHAGIIELPEDAELATPIAEALGLNDPVIDIALTPNRGDCLGVYGIARDLAAAGLGALKPLPAFNLAVSGEAKSSVSIEHPQCAEFTYAMLHNVQNGQSPEWMQQRLKAIGLRPISALVDVTNYISVAFARPLHVYDLDKLQGSITVREGKAGESFEGLHDKPVTLEGGEIAIADDSGVIGLGGIVGGVSTGCDENTQNVLLEVAWFDPITIAKTGRKLGIQTDARYRFERGVDPAFLKQGAELALELIHDLCSGESSNIQTTGKPIDWQREIPFDADRINARLGMEIPANRQEEILQLLGFELSDGKAVPPSWRLDVEGIADLSEEVARIEGYDKLPATPLSQAEFPINPRSESQERVMAAKQALAQLGLRESCHWSFLSSEIAPHFGGAPESLKLLNPISSELDQMRPSLLPHLIEAVGRNEDRGLNHAKLFEVGLQFTETDEKGQQMMASGVYAREFRGKSLRHHQRASDVYDAKAAIEAAINATGFDASRLQVKASAPNWYHPGKSLQYCLGKQVIAQGGELHPHILKLMDAPEGLIGFEIFLQAIPSPKKKTATRAPLVISEYQAVQRDFAFVVKQDIEAGSLLQAAQKADPKLVKHVELFDVYAGKGLEEDEKSLAISLTLQANDRTLTEEEIEAVSQKFIQTAEASGAKLRG